MDRAESHQARLKRCSGCDLTKPIIEFPRQGYSMSGEIRYAGRCRACARKWARAYRKTDDGRRRLNESKRRAHAKRRASDLEFRERERTYQREYRRRRYQSDPEFRQRIADYNQRPEVKEYFASYARAWRRANPLTDEQRQQKNSRERDAYWARRGDPTFDARLRARWNRRRSRERAAEAADTAKYREVLMRDPCAYCGERCAEVDHIQPIDRGGLEEPDNLTASCLRCNRSKGTSSLLAFLVRERGSPSAPTGQPS